MIANDSFELEAALRESIDAHLKAGVPLESIRIRTAHGAVFAWSSIARRWEEIR